MQKLIIITLSITLSCLCSAQVNLMKVGKNGITFQDGEVLSTSTNPSAGLPGGGEITHLLAEFSNGIVGDSPLAMWENHVELLSLDSYMFQDVNINNGKPIGDPRHRNFVMAKPVDVSSVDLLSAYEAGTPITTIKIKMIASPDGSSLQEILRVTLSNAEIVEYRMDLDFDPSTSNFFYTEKIYFTYSSIEYEHFGSGDNEVINWRY